LELLQKEESEDLVVGFDGRFDHDDEQHISRTALLCSGVVYTFEATSELVRLVSSEYTSR
jgi:hypothetical protein